jgi:tetrahydromethanopterin S-methyltransferase subunit G
MTTKNEKIGQGDITPVAARGAVRGNGVIYVLVIGVVLAIIAMFLVLKFLH